MNKQSLASQSPGNQRYFVYTGNAYPHKNLDRLIQAIVLVNRKHKVMLKISSSRNVFTDRLKDLISKNNANEYVDLLGYTSDEKIKSLYKNSVGFVFPTLSEGFGLPPMEAINAGTIAIVSDIPVLKEIYGNSVFYFDPYDVNSIAQKLIEILNLKQTDRSKVINNAQKLMKKYSWSKMAKETLKVYESVL